MSDTPRTDAHIDSEWFDGGPGKYDLLIPIDTYDRLLGLARQLERENAALIHDITRALDASTELLTENVELREKLARVEAALRATHEIFNSLPAAQNYQDRIRENRAVLAAIREAEEGNG